MDRILVLEEVLKIISRFSATLSAIGCPKKTFSKPGSLSSFWIFLSLPPFLVSFLLPSLLAAMMIQRLTNLGM